MYPEESLSRPSHAESHPLEAPPARRRLGRLLDVGLVLFVVATVGYLVFAGMKLVTGVTVVQATPSRSLRLEVIDATGGDQKAAVDLLCETLRQRVTSDLAVHVVKRASFPLKPLDRTVLVSHQEDLIGVRMLADWLDMERDKVLYRPMDVNDELIAATLVLGQDADVSAMTVAVNSAGGQ